MMSLLVFKERLKQFYGKNDFYLIPIVKFLMTLAVLLVVNQHIGFAAILKNTAIVLIISLVCSFVPVAMIVAIVCAFVLGHIFSLSLEIGAIMLVIMMVMYLVYYRFTPHDGVLLILMPLASFAGIPYVLPIMAGLLATPASMVSLAFGTVLYYAISYVSRNTVVITNIDSDEVLQKITVFMEGLFKDHSMYIAMAAFACVVVVVYVVRRLSVNHAWSIAIITGGLVNVGVFLIGDMVTVSDGTDVSVISLLIGTLISVAIAFVVQFLVFTVDYSRVEHVQFEDDDYYYYVKAIPKITVTTPEVSVKRINARRSRHPKMETRSAGGRARAPRAAENAARTSAGRMSVARQTAGRMSVTRQTTGRQPAGRTTGRQ
jgi:hypothetical protein